MSVQSPVDRAGSQQGIDLSNSGGLHTTRFSEKIG